MSRAVALLIALCVSPLLTLASQDWAALAPGDRVRLTTSWSALRLVGTVVAADSDSVRIQPQDAAVLPSHPASIAIARGSIRELEVGVKGRSHAGTGALIGLGIGAVGGALYGAADASSCKGFCLFDAGSEAVMGGVLFGAVGAGLGALIGAAGGSERWERVALDHTHATVRPRGASLALSFTF